MRRWGRFQVSGGQVTGFGFQVAGCRFVLSERDVKKVFIIIHKNSGINAEEAVKKHNKES